MVFNAIYFTRILLSLSQKVLDMKSALSYVAIDMPPEVEDSKHDKPRRFLRADPRVINEIVREKKLGFLNELGGLEEVAAILEIDMKWEKTRLLLILETDICGSITLKFKYSSTPSCNITFKMGST